MRIYLNFLNRQSNALTAVLENWESVENAIDIYANSAGSALQENEIYLDSWEAKSKALSASWNEFVNTFLNADIFKGFIEGATNVLKFLSDINGMIPIIAGLISGILAAAILKSTFTLEGFSVALLKVNIMSGGIPMLIGAIVALVGVGISWAVTASDTAKQIENLTEKIEEHQKKIDELAAKEKDVVDLYKEYSALMSKSNAYGLSAAEKESLLKISTELVDTYGLEVKGIDAVTGAYIVGADAINNYVEKLRQERIEEQKKQSADRDKRIRKNIVSAQKHQKKKIEYGVGIAAHALGGLTDPELESLYYKESAELGGLVNSIVEDIIANIQVDNANMLDAKSESLLTQMLMPYLSSDYINWETFDVAAFERKVKNFVDTYGQHLSALATESETIKNKINSNSVSVDDYKDFLENQMSQLEAVREAFGKDSKEAKAFEEQLRASMESNIGMAFADISNDLATANLDTTKFDELTTSILRLDKAMSNGKITFSEYIQTLNKEITDIDIEETFQGNTKAANEFFSTLVTKGKNSISSLVAEMQNGTISQKAYVEGLADIATFFVNLGDKAVTMPGVDASVVSDINETSDSLESLISTIRKYSTLISKIPSTWEEFRQKGTSGIKALSNAFREAGITAQDLGYEAGTTIDDIVKKAWDGEADFAKVQDAMRTKFKITLNKMGVAIGELINELAKQFGNVEFSIKAPEGGWLNGFLDAIKNGADLVFGVGVEPNIDTKAFGDTIEKILGDLDFSFLYDKPFGGGDGGGGDGGGYTQPADTNKGSEKNEALDKYLDEAERLYKIHQNEARYINDLVWARNNLVKSAEEDLKLAEKIDDAYRNMTDNQIKDLQHQIDLKKALHGDDYDATDEWTAIQDAAHQGADSYRAYAREQLGYNKEGTTDEQKAEIDAWIENTDVIQGLQKTWWDAENSKLDFYSKQHENILRDIEHARDMSLEVNPYADTTSYYRQMQDAYHQEAERLRALDPEKYKEEIQGFQTAWWEAHDAIVEWEWENSNRWISDRNAYNDWEMFGDSEIDAWERVIKWLNEDYPNDIDKIKEAEKNLFEARKKEFNDANSFSNSYIESEKTLLQAHFDVTNSIAEAQHEINKELETSKTMYEYLDEDTRKLLFNQEDYNALQAELNRIEGESLRIKADYEAALDNATLETIEDITANYQMQYETLMKSYEIAKADLEVAKKKAQLNNVLNERNVRMFVNGSWQWVANTEDVVNAKSELADAEYAQQVANAGLTQQKAINDLTKQQNELNLVIKKFEGGVITLDEAIGLARGAIGSLPKALSDMYKKAGLDAKTYSNGKSKSYNGVQYDSKTDYMNNIYNATSEAEVVANNVARNAKIAGDGMSEKPMSNDEAVKKWKEKRYADGSRSTHGGLSLMGEEGSEVYVTADGKLIPINQPTIGSIKSGGVVFNADQMKNLRTLWDMSNFNLNTSNTLLGRGQSQQTTQNYDNRIIINGMTVDSGSSDGQALISALRRYVGNH